MDLLDTKQKRAPGRPKGSAGTPKDVDAEISRLIEKRASQEDHVEHCRELELYELRQRRERNQEENRLAWLEHERHMERLHAALCEEHRAKAAALLNGDGATW